MYSCLVDDSGFREQICLGTLLFPFVGGNWRVPNKELDFSEMLLCPSVPFYLWKARNLYEPNTRNYFMASEKQW